MKYDGKDSIEISCDEFLEMPLMSMIRKMLSFHGRSLCRPYAMIITHGALQRCYKQIAKIKNIEMGARFLAHPFVCCELFFVFGFSGFVSSYGN